MSSSEIVVSVPMCESTADKGTGVAEEEDVRETPRISAIDEADLEAMSLEARTRRRCL